MALPESHQTFGIAPAQTTGPVNLVLSLQTSFLECSIHYFIDKQMVITRPPVASGQLLRWFQNKSATARVLQTT